MSEISLKKFFCRAAVIWMLACSWSVSDGLGQSLDNQISFCDFGDQFNSTRHLDNFPHYSRYSEISLKEFFERALESEREQRNLIRADLERRLSGMNELRAQIESERGKFVTRELHDQQTQDLQTRIVDLEKFRANVDGRMLAIGIVFSLIQLVLMVIGIFVSVFVLKKR